jgi:hypothetical protein
MICLSVSNGIGPQATMPFRTGDTLDKPSVMLIASLVFGMG